MKTHSLSLEGRVALVTGARRKRSIGRAIATGLAEAGADVAVGDLMIEDGELEATAQNIRDLGHRALAIQVDTSKKSDVDNMAKRVISEFGKIDILVNCAAIIKHVPLVEVSEDDWDMIMDINLKGYHLCCQTVSKHMMERKNGNIINIAGMAAVQARPGAGCYAICKTGVVMLTRLLAKELASYNIRVNALSPAMVKTESQINKWGDPQMEKELIKEAPMGRLAEPEDIVGPALFLASDVSSYITGFTINVDGGRMA